MISKWLLSKNPLIVRPALTCGLKALGIGNVTESMLLQQLNYWLQSRSARIINGRPWIYNTYEQWRRDNFPFWNESTIRRGFKKLEDAGIVITSNFNNKGFDKTKWYSIDYAKLDILMASVEKEVEEMLTLKNDSPSVQNEQTMCASLTDGGVQNEQMELGNLTTPIPETTRDYKETTTENINSSGRKQPEPRTSQSNQKPKKKDKYTQLYKNVISYLNHKTGTHYRATSKATQKLIRARAEEGYTLENFKRVIDNKAFSWQHSDMWKYMRPQTLFSPKFESYLNENDLRQTERQQPQSMGYEELDNYGSNDSFFSSDNQPPEPQLPPDDDLPF